MNGQSPSPSKIVNSSPLFESPEGWGPTFALAKGQGPGVVVGPGSSSPNVLGQSFKLKWGEQFRVTARASSVDKPEGMGIVQINWHDRSGQFISTSQEYFSITPQETTFQLAVSAPWRARQGVLYVAPGGPSDVVRYTEMTLVRLGPIDDFLSYKFVGLTGQNVLFVAGALVLLAVLYSFYRRALSRAGEYLVRSFPVVAFLLCGAMFLFLENHYEQHYDSQWHQTGMETVGRWNDISPDLRANPLHNFGIQHVVNPQLSPMYWVGRLAPADHRIQAQAAFQAMTLFALLFFVSRRAGARAPEASAISLVAVFYLWIPDLSGGAITLNATLGLVWQEGLIAALAAFTCFALIGYEGLRRVASPWPIVGFVTIVLWFILAWPEKIPFFTLATAGLCLGALVAVRSRKELALKSATVAGLGAGLLLAGFHNHVLNLFLYTPQMYYKTLYNHDFTGLFYSNTSLLLAVKRLGGAALVAFFVFALIGAYFAYRHGNSFARRVVFGALSLEVAIHASSAVNRYLKLVPLTFTYIEQMGLAAIALLAGTGVWAVLQLVCRIITTAALLASARWARRQAA